MRRISSSVAAVGTPSERHERQNSPVPRSCRRRQCRVENRFQVSLLIFAIIREILLAIQALLFPADGKKNNRCRNFILPQHALHIPG